MSAKVAGQVAIMQVHFHFLFLFPCIFQPHLAFIFFSSLSAFLFRLLFKSNQFVSYDSSNPICLMRSSTVCWFTFTQLLWFDQWSVHYMKLKVSSALNITYCGHHNPFYLATRSNKMQPVPERRKIILSACENDSPAVEMDITLLVLVRV